jgi:hypothetical protein
MHLALNCLIEIPHGILKRSNALNRAAYFNRHVISPYAWPFQSPLLSADQLHSGL